MEVSHPDPWLDGLLQMTRFALRRQPILHRFCESVRIVTSERGLAPELRVDWFGPGDFGFHAALRLAEVQYRSHGDQANIEPFLRECEEGWVREYDKWLEAKEAAS